MGVCVISLYCALILYHHYYIIILHYVRRTERIYILIWDIQIPF